MPWFASSLDLFLGASTAPGGGGLPLRSNRSTRNVRSFNRRADDGKCVVWANLTWLCWRHRDRRSIGL